MSEHAQFVDRLLRDGHAILRARPRRDEPPEQAVRLLRMAFETYRLQVAGPLIEFDATSALVASRLVHAACWYMVNRSEPANVLDEVICMPASPTTTASNLSADLTLRHLTVVHHRAKALYPDDRLVPLVETVLRQWPLSGVLADMDEGLSTRLDFANHSGLLLYAERFCHHLKSAWQPEGKGLEYVELVQHSLTPSQPEKIARE